MSDFATVKYSKEDDIANIVLNRPEVLNAYNMQMRDDIYQILSSIRDDSDILAITLTGEGERAFCTGADLTEFGSNPSKVSARQVRWERDVWGLLISISRPIVAGMNGYVVGSGLEMALLCDIRIASEDCLFWLPESGLGMLPAAGGSQSLPRTVGEAVALDLLLTGRRVDAKEALEMGLIHDIVPKEHLKGRVDSWAAMLAKQPSDIIRRIKYVIGRGMDGPLETGTDLELVVASGSFAFGHTG